MSNREAPVASADRTRIDAALRLIWAGFDDWTELEQGLARTVWWHAERAASAPQAVRMPSDERIYELEGKSYVAYTVSEPDDCDGIYPGRTKNVTRHSFSPHKFAILLAKEFGIVPLAPQDSTKEGGK